MAISHVPATHAEAIYRCASHLRLWLSATEFPFNRASRERFARAHPDLFGQAYHVTLRGYDRWRTGHRLADTVDTFAHYLARRHERWLAAQRSSASVAACLLRPEPCWKDQHWVEKNSIVSSAPAPPQVAHRRRILGTYVMTREFASADL